MVGYLTSTCHAHVVKYINTASTTRKLEITKKYQVCYNRENLAWLSSTAPPRIFMKIYIFGNLIISSKNSAHEVTGILMSRTYRLLVTERRKI